MGNRPSTAHYDAVIPPPTDRMTVEVKIGVVYTGKELLVEVEGKVDEIGRAHV